MLWQIGYKSMAWSKGTLKRSSGMKVLFFSVELSGDLNVGSVFSWKNVTGWQCLAVVV